MVLLCLGNGNGLLNAVVYNTPTNMCVMPNELQLNTTLHDYTCRSLSYYYEIRRPHIGMVYIDCIRLYIYSLLVMQLHHAGHAITRIVGLEI